MWKKQKLKNKYTKNKITKIKDADIEITVTPRLCICNENDIEIKNKYNKKTYKKSNFKKLKQSKRTIYQYKSLKGMEDSISTPKDLRFIIKGKPKKYTKKGRNIIKKEIMYYYKSPISQKKGGLAIIYRSSDYMIRIFLLSIFINIYSLFFSIFLYIN